MGSLYSTFLDFWEHKKKNNKRLRTLANRIELADHIWASLLTPCDFFWRSMNFRTKRSVLHHFSMHAGPIACSYSTPTCQRLQPVIVTLNLWSIWTIWMLLSWAKTYIYWTVKPQQDWVFISKDSGLKHAKTICYKRVCKFAHAGSSSCLFGSSSSVTKGSDGKCRAESGATGVNIIFGYPMCVCYRRPLLGRSSPSWHHKKVIILQVQRQTKGRKVAPASAFRCFFHRPSSSSSFVLPPSGTQHGHGRWDVILATGSVHWVPSQKWSKGSQDVGCINCPPSPLQHPWWQLPNSMMTRNPNQ